MYVLDFSWGRPACNAIKFDRVHGQLAGFNNHSKIFNLISGELAFFEFQMKVQLGHALQDVFGSFLMEGGVRGIDT